MVLSDKDIKKFIKSGDIVIDPYNEEMIKPASYTFTLNNVFWLPKKVKLLDLKSDQVEYDEITVGDEGLVLKPGDFLLGQIAEKLSISKKLACFLETRTSLARVGLLPLQGATFVQPGQEASHETLEISNISKSPIKIYPGMRIVKAIFVKLAHEADQSYAENGTYAGQTEGKAILGT